MIAVRDLVKSYVVDGRPLRAVDNVTFECARGEYISIMGHSGSGKSTLLSLIGGLTRPDSGDIDIEGTSILSLDDNALSKFRNRKLNYIFQFASLIPTLTALENVMLPVSLGAVRDRPKADVKKEAVGLLDMVGLADKVNAYPSQLSGGQQRRVAIARSFINDPEIVLADEPTGDLDEETEAEMMKIFKRMNREKGITFIVVTHSSAFAGEARRVLKMHNGRLEEVQVQVSGGHS
jgi:putative ABC transport system ATP-binding protein/lipoprotein-releasing system ATP-binding protein